RMSLRAPAPDNCTTDVSSMALAPGSGGRVSPKEDSVPDFPQPPRRVAGGIDPPLALYLREINETPLLGAAEERELALRLRGGAAVGRERMVRVNLPLVVSIARAYAGRGLPLPDLIEEGNLGLLRAVEDFDPGMNTRFSTYATYWIKQSIRVALLRAASP